jgi:hypothetical protein
MRCADLLERLNLKKNTNWLKKYNNSTRLQNTGEAVFYAPWKDSFTVQLQLAHNNISSFEDGSLDSFESGL